MFFSNAAIGAAKRNRIQRGHYESGWRILDRTASEYFATLTGAKDVLEGHEGPFRKLLQRCVDQAWLGCELYAPSSAMTKVAFALPPVPVSDWHEHVALLRAYCESHPSETYRGVYFKRVVVGSPQVEHLNAYLPGVGTLTALVWLDDYHAELTFVPWEAGSVRASFKDDIDRVRIPYRLWGVAAHRPETESSTDLIQVHYEGITYVVQTQSGTVNRSEAIAWTTVEVDQWKSPTLTTDEIEEMCMAGSRQRGDLRGLAYNVDGAECVICTAFQLYDDEAWMFQSLEVVSASHATSIDQSLPDHIDEGVDPPHQDDVYCRLEF